MCIFYETCNKPVSLAPLGSYVLNCVRGVAGDVVLNSSVLYRTFSPKEFQMLPEN
jgi:hypothetical protein